MNVAMDEFTIVGQLGPKYTDDAVVYDVIFRPETGGFLPIPQSEIDLSGGVFQQNAGH